MPKYIVIPKGGTRTKQKIEVYRIDVRKPTGLQYVASKSYDPRSTKGVKSEVYYILQNKGFVSMTEYTKNSGYYRERSSKVRITYLG